MAGWRVIIAIIIKLMQLNTNNGHLATDITNEWMGGSEFRYLYIPAKNSRLFYGTHGSRRKFIQIDRQGLLILPNKSFYFREIMYDFGRITWGMGNKW